MNYKSFPTVKNTPSRKQRKSQRSTVFMYNKRLRKLTDRPRGRTAVVR